MDKVLSIKQKLVVIVGPTASGKSELAVTIARRFNGEIISADSRQVYKGLDIGTGKVEGRWRIKPKSTTQKAKVFIYKGVPHHCIDFVSPRKQYTVTEYKKCAKTAVQDIAGRGRVSIIVGGSGFWIDAVVYDIDFPPAPPDKKLRRVLSKKDAAQLFQLLKKLDQQRAKTIDRHNARRLIRAIEIAHFFGTVPRVRKKLKYDLLWLGIRIPREKLMLRIKKRLQERMKRGMVFEARRLHQRHMPWKRFYELGLEYRFLADYLRGNLSKKEMMERLERAIWQYARRQIIWFKRNRSIYWICTTEEAGRRVKNFLGQSRKKKRRRI